MIGGYDFDFIRGKDKRVYLYLPTTSEDVVITLIPIESDVKLYVHPSSMPNDLEHSTWKMHSNLAKRLVITAEERRNLLVADANLFISVSAEQTASFVISINPYFEGDGSINPGYLESGSLKQEEFKNFEMVIDNETSSMNVFNIR